MNRRQALTGAGALAIAGCAEAQPAATPFPMRRAVNLGGGLEAPNEGEWGYTFRTEHAAAIAAAGFDGVRLPVRWDTHARQQAPYAIDPAFLARVHEIVAALTDQTLMVQLNVHHYEALNEKPATEMARFSALWRQIAESFASAPPSVMFEPLNEPNGDIWTGARVTDALNAAIEQIRSVNPERTVVIGGPNWNSISGLQGWTPPTGPNLALTVHYYEPHAFTHQNNEWMGAGAPRYPRQWGNAADRAEIRAHLSEAASWARRHGLGLQLGEFGVNRRAPLAQRALWTQVVRETCEELGMAWAVWDFGTSFEIFDQRRGAFIPELRAALFD